MNILLSIIIPCYKAENVLERCVESILRQTFKDFELILVGDGSHSYYKKTWPDDNG